MHQHRTRFLFAFLALAWAAIASADVLQQNIGGTDPNVANYFGESFTTPSGSPFNDILFTYFADAAGTTPFATGSLFLLSTLYTGAPDGLSPATSGYIATSTGITGGQWSFAPSVTLQSNTQYFVYTGSIIPAGSFMGGNVTAEAAYFASGATANFRPSAITANYRVSGDPVVTTGGAAPEPGTMGLLAGSLLFAAQLRRRGFTPPGAPR
jgi:hypothetical protein